MPHAILGEKTRVISTKDRYALVFYVSQKTYYVFLYYGRIQTNSHTADAMFDFLIIFNPTDNSRAPRDKS